MDSFENTEYDNLNMLNLHLHFFNPEHSFPESREYQSLFLQHKIKFKRLYNFFSNIKQNPKVYWPALFLFLHENKAIITNRSFLKEYPKCLLNELLTVGCSDLNLVRRILKLYGLRCSWKKDIMDYVEYRPMKTAVCRQIGSPLGSNEINDMTYLSDVELIDFALRVSDIKLFTALLRYGMCNIPHDVSKCEFPTAMQVLVHIWATWLKQRDVKPKSLNTLEDGSKNNGDLGNGKTRGFRRILSIIRVIEILGLNRYGDPSVENRVQCIRLYFRATIEPFISKEDVEELLCCFFLNMPEDFLEIVSQDYQTLFREESSSIYAPRALKHLCRYRFRKYVVEENFGILPEVIKGLRLPDSLASYLLCEY